MRGKFITFEGGEGSGKSTQARLLAEHLRNAGYKVIETREPGGSPFAERLRGFILDPHLPPHVPLSEALLFYAARADHIATVIRPALEEGSWVICDRFSDSTRVYQGAAGHLEQTVIDQLEALVVGTTQPDLTLLLDLAPELGLARAKSRGAGTDGYEARGLAYHERLRVGFLDLAARHSRRFQVLDGGDPKDAIAARVRDTVARRLGAP
jgi:dTMP kinase